MSRNSFSAMDVLFAFVLGGAMGAGLAMLLTPYTGEEARKRLKQSLEGYEDRAKKKLGAVKEEVEERAGDLKRVVQFKKDEINAAVEAGKKAYQKEKERLLKEMEGEG